MSNTKCCFQILCNPLCQLAVVIFYLSQCCIVRSSLTQTVLKLSQYFFILHCSALKCCNGNI